MERLPGRKLRIELEYSGGNPLVSLFGLLPNTIDYLVVITIDFAKRADISIPAECGNVARWYEKIANRPSAQA